MKKTNSIPSEIHVKTEKLCIHRFIFKIRTDVVISIRLNILLKLATNPRIYLVLLLIHSFPLRFFFTLFQHSYILVIFFSMCFHVFSLLHIIFVCVCVIIRFILIFFKCFVWLLLLSFGFIF